MKLIVTGATGLIGAEIVRQALHISEITQVVALARKSVEVDDGIDSSKLKSVVIQDYGEYPDHIKAEFAGANACIWTVAVTPYKSSNYDFAEVKRVCQDCTVAGFKAMYKTGPARPFRFIYFSGAGIPRDSTKKPLFLGDYRMMRGEVERAVLKLPADHDGVEVCIAQPGMVTNSTTWSWAILSSAFCVANVFTRAIPNVSRSELATAVLDQAIHGFEKETLSNADLVRLGQAGRQADKAPTVS